jgi:hypothetical protein
MKANAITAFKTSVSTAIRSALSAGAGAKLLQVYSGTIPTTAGAAVTTQVKLLEFTIDPATWDVTGGSLIVPASGTANGITNGIARWARFIDGNGDVVFDVDVSGAGGNGFIRLTRIDILTGQPCSILSGTIQI